ncbi:MAG: LysR substrate-binding domain-containing protein, partial [Pseudomonadota bacterium]
VTALQLISVNITTMLAALENHELDVVLTTELPPAAGPSSAGAGAGALGDPAPFAAQRIAEQPVGLHGAPDLFGLATLKALLAEVPLIVPTETTISAGLEALLATLNVTPRIAARVDDMAMVRLLAREGVGLAVAPAVVMADEIASGMLVTAPHDLGIVEPFYAVTLQRSFPHPMLADLLAAAAKAQV